MKKLVITLAAVLALAAMPTRAHAVFTLTLSQSGGNVVINGSGTLNTTALSVASNGSFAGQFAPASALLVSGPTTNAAVNFLGGGGFTGPTTFGIGGSAIASTGTGTIAGIFGSQHFLLVPTNYVSGTALTSSSTYNGATFASLNFTPGTYTYTWGTGVDADSLTVTSVVPEPTTWALLGLGAAGVGIVAFRRRRAVGAGF